MVYPPQPLWLWEGFSSPAFCPSSTPKKFCCDSFLVSLDMTWKCNISQTHHCHPSVPNYFHLSLQWTTSSHLAWEILQCYLRALKPILGICYGISNHDKIFFLLVTHAYELDVVSDLCLSLGPHASAQFKLYQFSPIPQSWSSCTHVVWKMLKCPFFLFWWVPFWLDIHPFIHPSCCCKKPLLSQLRWPHHLS